MRVVTIAQGQSVSVVRVASVASSETVTVTT